MEASYENVAKRCREARAYFEPQHKWYFRRTAEAVRVLMHCTMAQVKASKKSK